jgi:hypothetical protein
MLVVELFYIIIVSNIENLVIYKTETLCNKTTYLLCAQSVQTKIFTHTFSPYFYLYKLSFS